MQLTSLKTLYYLCRLSPARLEQFALAGGVPLLVNCITRSPKLAKVAVALLAVLPGASKTCRKELKRWRCLGHFVQQLSKHDKAIGGLITWVTYEPKLADELADSSKQLAEYFIASDCLEVTVQYYVKLLSLSSALCKHLARSDQFMEVLAEYLHQDRKKPALTRHCLELLHLLTGKSDRPRALMDRFNLYQLVLRILHDSRYDDLVILEEVATLLLDLYSSSVK